MRSEAARRVRQLEQAAGSEGIAAQIIKYWAERNAKEPRRVNPDRATDDKRA